MSRRWPARTSAAILVLQGQFAESVQAKYRAFRLADDEIQRMRYLGDLGEGLAQIGAYGAARTAFEIVIASQASFLVRTNAILELMELESGVDNRVAFERLRAEAESVRERMPPSMTADYLYKVGVGLARFGKVARAREVLSEGLRQQRGQWSQRVVLPDRADLAEPRRAMRRRPLASPRFPPRPA